MKTKRLGQIAEEQREWFSVHAIFLRWSEKSRHEQLIVKRANIFDQGRRFLSCF